ncbi:MAG: hypothetical protein M3Q29_05870 [Chloroflexota bacterium]|nr:hypothetical protein [Chloroflexota bacterium]
MAVHLAQRYDIDDALDTLYGTEDGVGSAREKRARRPDLRSVERGLGCWALTAVLMVLWLALDWPPSALLGGMGVQLLVGIGLQSQSSS